jgi:ketol-acid reductoisomerase
VLREVREGRFTEELQREVAHGYERLEMARAQSLAHPLEQSFAKLRRE